MTTASHVESERDRKIAGAIVWLGSALALLAGAVCLGFGQFESSEMQNMLDKLAPDGNAKGFGVERIEQIQFRASVAGLALFALVVFLTAAREQASHYISALLAESPRRTRRALYKVRRFFTDEPWQAIALILCVLTYVCIGAAWLDQTARTDEAQTFYLWVIKPWYMTLSQYTTNNHLLYSLLAKGSCQFGSDDLACLRLPALLAGIALIPAAYVCMRIHFGRSVGLLTAATLASSPYAIDFGTNGRGYTLVALIFMLLLAQAKKLPATDSVFHWSLFVALAVTGFFTVPIMAYPFAIVLVWVSWTALRELPARDWLPFAKRMIGTGLVTGLLVGALYTPAFIVTGLGQVVPHKIILSNQVEYAPSLFIRFAYLMQHVWKNWAFGLAPFFPLFLSLGCIVGALVPKRAASPHRHCLAAVLLGLGGVLGATKAIPPSWIFLFLLPVAVALGFSGWQLVWGLVGKTLDHSRVTAIVFASCVGILVTNTWTQLASESLDHVRWYVGYREAPLAAQVLIENLIDGDSVRAHLNVVPPLLFYLGKQGLAEPWSYAYTDPAPGHDYYVVESDRFGAKRLLASVRTAGVASEQEVLSLPHSRILRIRPSDRSHEEAVSQ